MSLIKIRRKILNRLAQSNLPTVPTEQAVNETPNPATPPIFNATNMYPSLRKGFSSGAINFINKLSSYLNEALFYASNGEYSMNKLYNLNFNFSPTMIPSVNRDLKNLVLFAKELYTQIYNGGNAYSTLLTAKEFEDKINTLLQSQNLNNLAQTNPTGQLAIKMGGNIKSEIINLLKYLINVAPAE